MSLAIVAMLARAILPDGWMPRADHVGISLVICTMNGPLRVVLDNDGQPTKQNPIPERTHHTDMCPFATAAHWAAPSPDSSLAPPSLFGMMVDGAVAQMAPDTPSRYALHAPSAPPFSV